MQRAKGGDRQARVTAAVGAPGCWCPRRRREMSIFKKGPGKIDLAAIPRRGTARSSTDSALPAIRLANLNPSSQTERLPASPRPPTGSQTDRGAARPTSGTSGGMPGSSAQNAVGGRPVRRQDLDNLEQRWKNRRPPRREGVTLDIEDSTPEGQRDGLQQLLADLPDNSRREEALRLLELLFVTATANPPVKTPPKTGDEVAEEDMEREMEELKKLMESNNVEAAEEKLHQIIADAEADGHIDEDEQKQIDEARAELEAMKERRAEAEKAMAEAKQKAELIALMAANDVDAAEKKLKEIIAAALEDGHIDEEEQKQIDEAQAELAKLKKRKEAMDRKQARMQAAKGGVGLGKEREERMQLSAAQRETAAERLRLATELRELKEAHSKLRSNYSKVKGEKAALDETLAATTVELEGLREHDAALMVQVASQQANIKTLTAEHSEMKVEVKKQSKLARAREKQVEELQAAMEEALGRMQKDYDILSVKEQRASQQAADLANENTSKADEISTLRRENGRLETSLKLEASAAQLERSTCDKFRVRCVDMEDKWARAVADRDHHNAKAQALEAELEDTRHHLAEATLWHRARVAARNTTRALLALPPETQEISMQQCQLEDNDCIMVAEFLINNLMIVSCDLSRNGIGAQGCTAMAQALSSNRVLTSLSLKDNPVGADGAEKLASMLHSNQTIERLNLMGCGIGDEGGEALASALRVSTSHLQVLALRFNGISDRGCLAIAQALETNTSLTELGLNNNEITDDGVACLAITLTKNTTLSLLRLTECPIGRESLKRLTNSKRPGLHLYF